MPPLVKVYSWSAAERMAALHSLSFGYIPWGDFYYIGKLESLNKVRCQCIETPTPVP